MNFGLAVIIIVAMIGSYLWGYRDGVKYCVRQMRPLGDMAKDLADRLREQKRD